MQNTALSSKEVRNAYFRAESEQSIVPSPPQNRVTLLLFQHHNRLMEFL